VSWNGGINFWIGNNDDFPETAGIRPGIRWGRLVERARCEGGASTRGAESRWFLRQGLAYLAAHPLRWIGDELVKLRATIGAREIGRNREIYDVRRESIVLSLLLWPIGFPFVVLFPATVAAASAMLRKRRLDPLLMVVILGVLAASVVFFPTARYRVPAIAPMIALAALGLPHVRWRELLIGLAALVLCLAPHALPRIPSSETLYEIGLDREQAGHPREALVFYERALALEPDSADIELVNGLALVRTGREDEAWDHLERAVSLDPDAAVGWQALAMIRWRDRRVDQARHLFERAIAADPCQHRIRAAFADFLIGQGYLNAAREQLAEAQRVYPRPDAFVERTAGRLRQLEEAGRPGTELP